MGKLKELLHTRSNSANRIIKSLSIFGSVQMLTILCGVIRTKLVAVWIGAAGVGLYGLYSNALELLSGIFQLGIRTSSVRDLSAAEGQRFATIARVVRRWGWILGLFGALATITLARPLSQWTFNDTSHTLGFVALSVVILLNSLTAAEQSIMQGKVELRRLALANLWGVVTGLAVSIPLYYYAGIHGIIPSLIAYSGGMALFCYVYRSKPEPSEPLTFGETASIGAGFIRLGIIMTVSVFITQLVNYIFLVYMTREAGIDELGIYQAGYALTNRYMGLIFTAISMEYYPRLTKVVGGRWRTSTIVSHEIATTVWILIPTACSLIMLNKIMLTLLYDSEFIDASSYVCWCMPGILLRAVSWSMAYVIIARGDGKIYIITETLSGIVSLTLNIAGYKLGGLAGLGMAYSAWYLFYTIMIWIVYHRLFRLNLSAQLGRLTLLGCAATTVAAFSETQLGWWWVAAIATALLLYPAYRHVMRK